VVLLCNKNYFPKFLQTVSELTSRGNYHGDICLLIGNDLVGDELLNNEVIKNNRVIIQHFPDLQFPDSFLKDTRKLPTFHKQFQYNKFHVFNTYFKHWDTLLYIDCGMSIYSDIRPILETRQMGTLLAHSDAYPNYAWKLRDQFKKDKKYYKKLREKFNLDTDYFQTTMMLFDTSIIQENTFNDLYQLTLEYPISRTNDQGIIALYFTHIVPVWKQIPVRNEVTFFYDFFKRNKEEKYIMIKYP
jgi:hypothetical protein